jgi:hypothetical protein
MMMETMRWKERFRWSGALSIDWLMQYVWDEDLRSSFTAWPHPFICVHVLDHLLRHIRGRLAD